MQCHYVERRNLFTIMMSVITLNFIVLSVVMINMVMLSVMATKKPTKILPCLSLKFPCIPRSIIYNTR
jgi:hypothetical protein